MGRGRGGGRVGCRLGTLVRLAGLLLLLVREVLLPLELGGRLLRGLAWEALHALQGHDACRLYTGTQRQLDSLVLARDQQIRSARLGY